MHPNYHTFSEIAHKLSAEGLISPSHERKTIDIISEHLKDHLYLVWCVSDVHCAVNESEGKHDADTSRLTDEQCREVLSHVDRHHDANYGVSWETLSIAANYLFPVHKDAPTIS